jgi:hypothetical protein
MLTREVGYALNNGHRQTDRTGPFRAISRHGRAQLPPLPQLAIAIETWLRSYSKRSATIGSSWDALYAG